MFEKKGVLFISNKHATLEDIEMHAIESGALDVFLESGYIKVICSVADYARIEKYFETQWIEIYESKLDFIPNNEIDINDFDTALKFTKMIEAFDTDEDVNFVSSNEIISAELQTKVFEFIEKNSFRT